MKQYFVYLLASKRNGTLYIGVTNDLARRVGEHKEKMVPGFTRQYGVEILVWYEVHNDINQVIAREADQRLESHLENPANRKDKPGME